MKTLSHTATSRSALTQLLLPLALAVATPLANAADSWVIALNGNGVLSWTNQSDAASYKILWAPTVEGPWSDSWEAFARIPATGEVVQVSVPMFYRVAQITQTNTLLIHGDGPDNSVAIGDSAGHAITRYGDTQVSATNIQGNRTLTIGAADNPALFFNGYLDEIRIAKGRAAWTADIIPPNTPYPN